jgi:hypothetical protein
MDHEKKRLEKNAIANARRKEAACKSDRSIENARKEIARKPKVAPVVAVSSKARALADGLKSMSIGKKKGANRKVDMGDSSDEELALDTNGDIVGKVKPIFKKANYMFSRKRL